MVQLISLQGDHVWIPNGGTSEFHVPIGAQVVHQEAGKTKLIDDEGEVGFFYKILRRVRMLDLQYFILKIHHRIIHG